MILVTVGTQLPFDRLIRAMDEAAPTLGEPVVAQIGDGLYEPGNMRWHRSLDPSAFDALLGEARLIVSHAGIGSVLIAQRQNKPIILLARRAAQGEHRNDHQLATAAALAGRSGIHIARDEAALLALLGRDLSLPDEQAQDAARVRLRSSVERFIRGGVSS